MSEMPIKYSCFLKDGIEQPFLPVTSESAVVDGGGVTLKKKLEIFDERLASLGNGLANNFNYASGVETLVIGEYVNVCSLVLEPNSTYMIFSSAECTVSTDARYSLVGIVVPSNVIQVLGPNTVRQTGNSGGGITSHNLVQTGNALTRYYVRSYAYGGMPEGAKVSATLLVFKLA